MSGRETRELSAFRMLLDQVAKDEEVLQRDFDDLSYLARVEVAREVLSTAPDLGGDNTGRMLTVEMIRRAVRKYRP